MSLLSALEFIEDEKTTSLDHLSAARKSIYEGHNSARIAIEMRALQRKIEWTAADLLVFAATILGNALAMVEPKLQPVTTLAVVTMAFEVKEMATEGNPEHIASGLLS